MCESIHVSDVLATILDQMGLDHEQLTYLHAGLDRKLTGVGGNVLSGIFA